MNKFKHVLKKINKHKKGWKLPATTSALLALIIVGVPGALSMLMILALLNLLFDSIKNLLIKNKKEKKENGLA